MRAIVSRGNCPRLGLGFGLRPELVLGLGVGGGATRQLPQRKIPPGLGLGFGLELVFGLGGGAIFLGDNCPRTEKQLCRSLIYNEGAGCMDKSNFLASHFTRRRCFPVKFAKFLRTPLENTNNSVEHLRSCKVLFVNC